MTESSNTEQNLLIVPFRRPKNFEYHNIVRPLMDHNNMPHRDVLLVLFAKLDVMEKK